MDNDNSSKPSPESNDTCGQTINQKDPKAFIKDALVKAIVEEGSLYAACIATCTSYPEALTLQKEDAEFAKALQMATTGCIDTVTSRLYKIAASEKGLDGHGGGVMKASELFLKRHGALTDVTTIQAAPEGLAEISRAVQRYKRDHPEKAAAAKAQG